MKNGDQPASPYIPASPWDEVSALGFSGFTKREYFAAMAMQGLLSCDARYGGQTNAYDKLALDSVHFADALLSELEKPTT